MHIEDTELPEVKVLTPRIFEDGRGAFAETWNRKTMAALGLGMDFVQDNHSVSENRWTVRGLHFQIPPHAQGKLVRVVRGAVLDVAVDIRQGSPTFGRHVCVELTAENWKQLWVPAGFAHGFCTLLPETEVVYKVTDYYAPDCERGVIWSDPDLGIPWPVSGENAVVVDRDQGFPTFSQIESYFTYGETQ